MELGDWKSYETVLRYAHLAQEHLSTTASRTERKMEVVELNPTLAKTKDLRVNVRPCFIWCTREDSNL